MSYRDRLFESYHETHARYLDSDAGKAPWFTEHVRQNYLARLPAPLSDPRILEIGCGKGFMLAALRDAGFTSLTGVDLSPADVEQARARLPGAELHCADGMAFMKQHAGAFDVIIAKAVLEHQEKADVLPLFEVMRTGLRPAGRVLIEVPNMDWLLASHERYMDFTHEVGFTRESLAQLLRLVYGNAEVHAMTDPTPATGLERLWRPAVRAVAVKVVGLLLRELGHSGHDTLWNTRSILGVARVAVEQG